MNKVILLLKWQESDQNDWGLRHASYGWDMRPAPKSHGFVLWDREPGTNTGKTWNLRTVNKTGRWICDTFLRCCCVLPLQVIESLGIMIYKALDFGLKENEERELSPPLEQLIDLMTNSAEAEKEACLDEGYEATEEEDETDDGHGSICGVHSYRDILKVSGKNNPNCSRYTSFICGGHCKGFVHFLF